MHANAFLRTKGTAMKGILAGVIASGIFLTSGTGHAYAQETEKIAVHEKTSIDGKAQFSLENYGDTSGILTLMDASFRQGGEIIEIIDASGTVLETLPELSEHGGKIVRYDYMMSSKRKVDVSAELSPEDAYEGLRCVTDFAGAAIVRRIGGAAAGGAGGSVLPGAGTLAGAIGYGMVSAIGPTLPQRQVCASNE